MTVKISYPTDIVVGPNCGVTAIACLTGKSVAWVYEHMKARFGRRGNWKGRTNHSDRVEVLADLGIKLTPVYKAEQYINANGELKTRRGPQLEKWVTNASRDRVFYVMTTNHVQIVYKGLVYDQSSNGVPVTQYWGRRKFIKQIMGVVKCQNTVV